MLRTTVSSSRVKVWKLCAGVPSSKVNTFLIAASGRFAGATEPLYQLARYHRERDELALAYLFARQVAAIPYPSDVLFIDAAVYRWQSLDELGIAAYWANSLTEGEAAVKRLLAEGYLPASERPRIEANLRFYIEKPASGS